MRPRAHTRSTTALLFTLALALAATGAAGSAGSAAQVATARPLDVVAVDTSAAPKVAITVTVPRELAGRRLDADAFTVIEAGRRRLPTLTSLPSDPLAVVLLLDTSASMRGAPIEAAKSAAKEFVGAMPAGTSVALVTFADTTAVAQPFTSDTATVDAAIDGVIAGGETALYDGIVAAGTVLATTGQARRAVVLLSDGGDTRSTSTIDQATSALTVADSNLYAVGLATGESDLAALNRLASSAGGRVASAADPAGLGAVYEEIGSAITSTYQLAFKATQHGQTPVLVTVADGDVTATASFTVDLGAPTTVPTARAAPARATTISTPLFGGATWALALGSLLLALGMMAAGVALVDAPAAPSTLAADRRRRTGPRHQELVGGLVEGASRAAERTLERHPAGRSLDTRLERAGIDMRPGEFSVLVAGFTFAALVVGFVLVGPLLGLVLGLVPWLVARQILSAREERRRHRFAEQLGDTLQLVSGSLRSGYGLMQAVDTVAQESESPTREEFRRILVETRLGKSLGDALDDAASRMGNDDFGWVVQAIGIHREIGGDLAEVLDHIAATIRSRNSLRRQVHALSAEGRLSAAILLALPIGLTLVISLVHPSYLEELTGTTAGNVMIAVGVALLLVGGLWMRRIVRIRF